MYASGLGCSKLRCSGSIKIPVVLRERNTIYLRGEAQKKAKRIAPERYIHPIPPQLVCELPYFFE